MGIKTRVASVVITAALGMSLPLIEKVEGVRNEVYIDVAGVPTVCAGITGVDVIKGKSYTNAECRSLLLKHVKIASDYVDQKVTYPIPDSMKASLYSFTFNAGRSAFGKSTILRLTNQGKLKQACSHLYDWVYYTNSKGVKVKSAGLKNRRDYEYSYCVKDLK